MESEPSSSSPPSASAPSLSSTTKCRRPECLRCQRPLRVCLCSALPAAPFHLPHVQIIVLEYEEEARASKLRRTVPILPHIIGDIILIKGRRFGLGIHPILDQALSNTAATLLLFPAKQAIDIRNLPSTSPEASSLSSVEQQLSQAQLRTLLVIDGTWVSAKSVYQKTPYLQSLTTVTLPLYPKNSTTNTNEKEKDNDGPSLASTSSSSSPSSPQQQQEEELTAKRILGVFPHFTTRKEPTDLIGKGRSTAEAVAACLVYLPTTSEEEKQLNRATAQAIIDAVRHANDLQLACMKPENIRHRPDRPGYIPNLYDVEGREEAVKGNEGAPSSKQKENCDR